MLFEIWIKIRFSPKNFGTVHFENMLSEKKYKIFALFIEPVIHLMQFLHIFATCTIILSHSRILLSILAIFRKIVKAKFVMRHFP